MSLQYTKILTYLRLLIDALLQQTSPWKASPSKTPHPPHRFPRRRCCWKISQTKSLSTCTKVCAILKENAQSFCLNRFLPREAIAFYLFKFIYRWHCAHFHQRIQIRREDWLGRRKASVPLCELRCEQLQFRYPRVLLWLCGAPPRHRAHGRLERCCLRIRSPNSAFWKALHNEHRMSDGHKVGWIEINLSNSISTSQRSDFFFSYKS